MNAYLVRRRGLPSAHVRRRPAAPLRGLTLSEIAGQLDRVIAMLEHGGAISVYSDDQQQEIGVLTRDRGCWTRPRSRR